MSASAMVHAPKIVIDENPFSGSDRGNSFEVSTGLQFLHDHDSGTRDLRAGNILIAQFPQARCSCTSFHSPC
jgi:hypothetical protein